MKPHGTVEVTRLPHRIEPNPSRVITRYFEADEAKSRRRIDRVLSLDDGEAARLLEVLRRDYVDQHADIETVWRNHFERVEEYIPSGAAKSLDDARRDLIGAYFTMEYAIESAALFNPSMVPTADQAGLAEG